MYIVYVNLQKLRQKVKTDFKYLKGLQLIYKKTGSVKNDIVSDYKQLFDTEILVFSLFFLLLVVLVFILITLY